MSDGGFIGRMSRQTGSPVPVWLYLFEKVCHVSFIVVVAYAAGQPLLRSAIIAAVSYLLISKLLINRLTYHDWSTFWRDGKFWRRAFFIALTLALIPVLIMQDWRYLVGWVVLWIMFEALGWAEQ
jgi:hypothetical protein